MQTPTHLATGILIDQAVPEINPRFIRRLLIALLGVYSHAILDALSALTYHPPDPSPRDRFWLGYHVALAVLTFRVWTKNQEKHKLAMIFAVLPDLDWLPVKIPDVSGIHIPFWRRPILHECLFKTLYSLPPLKLFNRLPDLRHKRAAAILELTLYMLLSGAK